MGRLKEKKGKEEEEGFDGHWLSLHAKIPALVADDARSTSGVVRKTRTCANMSRKTSDSPISREIIDNLNENVIDNDWMR